MATRNGIDADRMQRAGWHFAARMARLTVALLAAQGCTSYRPLPTPAVLASKNDVARYLIQALADGNPDARRDAVLRAARSRHADETVVVEALCTIARTDSSRMVRCAAIGALGEAADPMAVETLVAIVAGAPGPAAVRPPAPPVRAHALAALCQLDREHAPTGETAVTARKAAVDLLIGHESRELRIQAARYLGSCPSSDALSALISSLDQRDFGVVYQAEASLVRLTGESFQHDRQAWEAWRLSQSDPFVAYRVTLAPGAGGKSE